MTARGMLGTVTMAAALAGVIACGGRDQAGKGPTVTVTGCLEPGDAPNTFRLAAVGSPNGATGTTGDNQTTERDNPTGTAAKSNSSDIGAATTRVYTLIPSEKADLSMHEGTIVQVTGQLESNDAAGVSGTSSRGQASGSQGQATTGQGTNASDGQGGDNNATGTGSNSFAQGGTSDRGVATVRVASIKRVAGSCGDTR